MPHPPKTYHQDHRQSWGGYTYGSPCEVRHGLAGMAMLWITPNSFHTACSVYMDVSGDEQIPRRWGVPPDMEFNDDD